MLLYGVATLPLIDILEDHDFTHKGYADEVNVADSLELLRIVLDKLYEHGGLFVYMAVHGAPENCTEGILLIYARYPINSLNREMSSKNIRKLCHSIFAAIRNSYKTTSAFSVDKRVIKSQEGTILGDPIAMLLYAVATLPLIDIFEDHHFTHKWYAVEGNVNGSLELLRIVLDKLYEHGGPFVYMTIRGFSIDKTVIKSQERITQGNPIAILLYGVATLPLIDIRWIMILLINGTPMMAMWPVVLSCYKSF